jgi:hypothetical protein
MELSLATVTTYVDLAFDQMLVVARRLGDGQVNRRPLGAQTNAVAPLIVHCCGVAEFWLGHVGLGRPSHRTRAAEFERTATVGELEVLVAATVAQIHGDVAALEAGRGTDEGGRQFLPGGDETDASVVLHVLEEAFQHLGHMEIAADAVLGS